MNEVKTSVGSQKHFRNEGLSRWKTDFGPISTNTNVNKEFAACKHHCLKIHVRTINHSGQPTESALFSLNPF